MNKLSSNITRIDTLMQPVDPSKPRQEGGMDFKTAVYRVTKRQDFSFSNDDAKNLGCSSNTINDTVSKEIIQRYRAYTDFKTAKFKSVGDPIYNTDDRYGVGQIVELHFASTT